MAGVGDLVRQAGPPRLALQLVPYDLPPDARGRGVGGRATDGAELQRNLRAGVSWLVHHLLDASAPPSASCACRRTSASRWEGIFKFRIAFLCFSSSSMMRISMRRDSGEKISAETTPGHYRSSSEDVAVFDDLPRVGVWPRRADLGSLVVRHWLE